MNARQLSSLEGVDMDNLITIKIARTMHDKLKIAHVREMTKKKKAIPFIHFSDLIIQAGLRSEGYRRFAKKN